MSKYETEKGVKNTSARRNTLKGLAVGGGVITLSTWSKPVVRGVVVPVHAAMSTFDAREGGFTRSVTNSGSNF